MAERRRKKKKKDKQNKNCELTTGKTRTQNAQKKIKNGCRHIEK